MRDFLPVLSTPNTFRTNANGQPTPRPSNEMLINCTPLLLENGLIGAAPRPQFTNGDFTPNSSLDRGRGIVSFKGDDYLYLDQDTYYYDGGSQDLNSTSAPGYAGNTGHWSEIIASFVKCFVSGDENLVIVNAGQPVSASGTTDGNVWYQSSPAATPSSIDSANMPGNNGEKLIRGGAYLDGYLFVADDNGQIHNSNLNDITTWTALDFITAEREPDRGVYLGKHKDNIIYIGTRTIEFFYNAGNATGSPLARRQDVSYRVGTAFPNSVVEAGDILYFAGTDAEGTQAIYKLENFQLSVISDYRMNDAMQQMPDINAGTGTSSLYQVWLAVCTMGGSPGLIFTYSSRFTYYYHAYTGRWTAWSYGAAPQFDGPITDSAGWASIFPVVSHNNISSSAGYYQFANGWIGSPSLFHDDDAMNDLGQSNTPNVHMMFARWDGGTAKKKRINSVRAVTRSGPISSINISADLYWADYDKVPLSGYMNPPDSYSGGRSIDMGSAGGRVYRLGTTRERAFMLDWPLGHGTISIVVGLEIDYDIVE